MRAALGRQGLSVQDEAYSGLGGEVTHKLVDFSLDFLDESRNGLMDGLAGKRSGPSSYERMSAEGTIKTEGDNSEDRHTFFHDFIQKEG